MVLAIREAVQQNDDSQHNQMLMVTAVREDDQQNDDSQHKYW